MLYMSAPTLPERVQWILDTLHVDQPTLATLCGTSRAMVNHWLLGRVKSINAQSAFSLQRRKGISAEWLMLGTGPRLLADVKAATDVNYVTESATSASYVNAARIPTMQEWPFAPASEEDYRALPEAGKRHVKGQLALAIDEAKSVYGPASGKRTA